MNTLFKNRFIIRGVQEIDKRKRANPTGGSGSAGVREGAGACERGWRRGRMRGRGLPYKPSRSNSSLRVLMDIFS